MEAQGRACKKELTTLGVDWKPSRRRKGIATPVRVPSLVFGTVELAPTFRKPPFVMDCHLALALTKASTVVADAGVSELRFSSIYSYRKAKVNGVEKDVLSRHSYGLAVDVYEVRDELGEIFNVEDHYAEVQVIQRLEERLNETGLFRLVLSPANDPVSHSNHLHLEARVPSSRERDSQRVRLKPTKRRKKPRRRKRR